MRFFLLIVFVLFWDFSLAQKFHTSIAVSYGVSKYLSTNKEVSTNNSAVNNFGIGHYFSATISEEYYILNNTSIGIGLNYVNSKGNFTSPSLTNHSSIPEVHSGYLNVLTFNSLSLPLFFKVNTNKEITKGVYFYAGLGLSYFLTAKRSIDFVTTYDSEPGKRDVSHIAKENIKLKSQDDNKMGRIGMLGIGKNILIKNRVFYSEVKYSIDLNNWTYPQISDTESLSFDLKSQCLLVSIGVKI